jgi:spore germination protein GerM
VRIGRSVLATTAVFGMITLGLMAFTHGVFSSVGDDEAKPEVTRAISEQGRLTRHLYYLDEDHRFLKAEERTLVEGDSVVEQAKETVKALIDGPQGRLLPTIPRETRLLSLYLSADGIAYVNFDRTIREEHSGGCLSEFFTVFSIVNSLSLNIPEISAVKILVEGQELKTIAGHIDTRFPFRPNMLMIK